MTDQFKKQGKDVHLMEDRIDFMSGQVVNDFLANQVPENLEELASQLLQTECGAITSQ